MITIGAPFVTKDPPAIWGANLALLVGSYAYGYVFGRGEEAEQVGGFSGVLRYLDFGSGQERGVRGAARERLFAKEAESKADAKSEAAAVGSGQSTAEAEQKR